MDDAKVTLRYHAMPGGPFIEVLSPLALPQDYFYKNRNNFNTFWHNCNSIRINLFHFTESKQLLV